MEGFLPLIDMVFLTMGTLLVLMTQMERVISIPVDFVKVGTGAVISKKIDNPIFVAVSFEGLFIGQEKVDVNGIKDRLKGKEVILRVDKQIPYGQAMKLVAVIKESARHISLEVKDE